ncbi:MAG: replication initiation protein RepC [Rhizobiaceae bacterium]|nr:replication initiation protein RepC [Rhizobiaceae bacterium]
MDGGSVTTPFGRRPMTLGMLVSQFRASGIEAGRTINKWKIFRAICEARPLLGVTDRALSVLDALLSFYPGDELSEENGLVVFPSNAQLSVRAHGMTPATLRRHLAVLVEAGLLVRKDSPNGKRYARRGQDGTIDQAFGFSIAPLLARSSEIETLAARVEADRQLMRVTKERLSLCRRDIAKLINVALEEGAPGNWPDIHDQFRAFVDQIPRAPSIHEIAEVLENLEMLREEIVNLLEIRSKTENLSSNESQTERHKQTLNPNSNSELEPGFEQKLGENSENTLQHSAGAMARDGQHGSTNVELLAQNTRIPYRSDKPAMKTFPLGMVLQACPEITMYGPGGSIGSWRDLMTAAVVVRSMLAISPSAYQQACDTMGPENAAIVVACVLQRAEQINSAGGYLRELTRRAERSEFAIGPMLMALARSNAQFSQKAG